MTRKEEIVQMCMEIFSESGVQGLTMKAMAERLQITEPAIYRHFENKQAVIVAMITQIRDEIFRFVDDVIQRPLNAVEKLHKIFGYHLFYLREKKAIILELLSEPFRQYPEVHRHITFLLQDYHRRIRQVVVLGIKKREIPRNVQPEAVSILFLGSLQHLLTIFKLEGNEEEIDLLSEEVFRHFCFILEGGGNYEMA